MSDLHATPPHSDSGRRAPPTCTRLHDFQIAVTAPALIPRLVIAALHGVAFGFPLDALCAVDVCWAASDARIGIEELDVGLLAANKGTLARVPKTVGNASLLPRGLTYPCTDQASISWGSPSPSKTRFCFLM